MVWWLGSLGLLTTGVVWCNIVLLSVAVISVLICFGWGLRGGGWWGLDWCGFWLLGGNWFVVMCWFLWRLDPGLMPGFLGCVHGCLMCFSGAVLL